MSDHIRETLFHPFEYQETPDEETDTHYEG
jgi:hypothetical protein